MLPLACLLAARGHDVSGSDRTQLREELAKEGVRSAAGSAIDRTAGVELVIRSAAVPLDDPELAAAVAQGIPIVKYSEALGRLMHGQRGLAVAGTHGKTSATALLSHLLRGAGRDPSWIVGGRPVDAAAWCSGDSDLLCVEACEYDHSFLNLTYEVAIITGISADHLDCFGDELGVQRAFAQFAAGQGPEGQLVLGPDVPGSWDPGAECRGRVTRVSEALQLRSLEEGPAGYEGVLWDGREEHPFRFPVLGRHNVDHLRSALVAASSTGVPLSELVPSAANFHGVERRLEDLGECSGFGIDEGQRGVRVVDDFAHHPEALVAAARAMRARFPGRRLVGVFQPHQVSRTADFLDAFRIALRAFDHVALCDIFVARDAHPERAHDLCDALAADSGGRVCRVGPAPLADERVASLLRPGDACVVMGAGDVDGLARRLAGRAARS